MTTNNETNPSAVRSLGFPDEVDLPDLDLTLAWLEARDFPRDRIPDVLELIRRAYNGGPIWFQFDVPPAEHLVWKLAPPRGASVTYVRDTADQIVGFTGTLRRDWLIRGQRVVGQDGIDLALEPARQQRGVPRAIQRARGGEGWHPEVEFALGWATHPANRKMALEQGRIAPGNPAHDSVRVLRPGWRRHRRALLGPSRTAAQIIANERSHVAAATRRLRLGGRFVRSLIARRPHRRSPGVGIRTAVTFDRLSTFLPEALESFDFIQERTPEYLNWRYADPRGGPATVRVAEEEGIPVGYAVTAVRAGLAYVADLLALPEREDVAESLLRDGIAIAREAGVSAVLIRLPAEHPYVPAIRRSGFVDLGARAGELLNPGSSDPGRFSLFGKSDARVHLVFGDTDIV